MDATMRPPWLLHLDSGKVEIIFVYCVINQVDFSRNFVVVMNLLWMKFAINFSFTKYSYLNSSVEVLCRNQRIENTDGLHFRAR